MTFEKASIILLPISNIIALYTNHTLFDLIGELRELLEQSIAINKRLIAWIERD